MDETNWIAWGQDYPDSITMGNMSYANSVGNGDKSEEDEQHKKRRLVAGLVCCFIGRLVSSE